jgi:hypothetical protein
VTHPDVMDEPEASPLPVDSKPAARDHWLSADVAVRWLGWLIPLGLFGWFLDFRLLDITRVFPLLVGDWSTYIAAPNFVRDGPWLSFPIGRIPGYMAPVGTWLGQIDSWPILYPLYRALSWAMPHRPFQLIGWQLLASMVLTFGVVRRYLRMESLETVDNKLRAEIVATAGAVVLLAQPYYLVHIGHPALFQMWVIPWGLIVSSRLLEQRRGGNATVTTWAFLAPLATAAVLNPYLLLMLLPVMFIPLVATARNHVRESVTRIVAAVLIVVGVSLVLGYIGTGGRPQSDGFGLYMADAGLLFDAGSLSRTWPNFPPNLTYEGYGFLGTALSVLVVAVVTTIIVRRLRGQRSENRTWMWPLWVGVGLSMLWAMMPVVRLFNHPLVDLNDELSHFSRLTASVRTNGRFAWPLLWMIGLVTVRYLARQKQMLAHGLLVVAAVAQVADAVPPWFPTAQDRYGPAMAIVRNAVATGITRVEFEPPNIWTDCPAYEFGPFESIAQLAVASAVEGLAVNSGYASRGNDEFLHDICEDQRAAYLAGRLEPNVLYVLPPGVAPVSTELECRPTDLNVTVCRLPQGSDVGG